MAPRKLPRGPYTVEPFKGVGGTGFYVKDADDGMVCAVLPKGTGSSDARTIANGLSAMPELLDAAKAVLSVYEHGGYVEAVLRLGRAVGKAESRP